jgi:hypothetical protein
MPITRYLDGQKFDPKTERIMGVALEMARIALLLDQNDPAVALVAKRVIELAKNGEQNPDLLCELVLKEFGEASIIQADDKERLAKKRPHPRRSAAGLILFTQRLTADGAAAD